ncbi:MAG: NAD(P)/FAD-dependent oxidoreductase, partial [Tenericutes bacterium]|nr:NAD(P)/FAD-dependent oxidoreductase [Mycoplasmatota bacterium]
MHDVIIIGAGASGCFLAINLKIKNPKLDVLLLEKNEKLGKKILITGNGRCNLGNENEDLKNYNSTSKLDEFNT